MRFSKKQCAQCPFRPNALPGWLGNYTPGDVASSIWKGRPFFCHTSVDYEDKDWERKAMQNGKLCTGSLVFAKRMMAPASEISDPRLASARVAALKVEDEIECMGPREFIDHHTDIDKSFEKIREKGLKVAPMDPEPGSHVDPLGECPSFDPSEERYELTSKILKSDAWHVVEKLLGHSYLQDIAEASDEDSALLGALEDDDDHIIEPGTVSFGQLIWLANQPWEVLQPHAREIFVAIGKLGQGALIPIDVKKKAGA